MATTERPSLRFELLHDAASLVLSVESIEALVPPEPVRVWLEQFCDMCAARIEGTDD